MCTFSTHISFISVIPYCRQISVLFILWVIHICSDLRLYGFGGGGLGVSVSGCTGEGLGMKLKKMISLSLPFPPLPLLNHDKNPRSSQKPISWSCKNRQEKRLSLAVIWNSYSSSQCYWPYPWRGEYFPPSTPCSNPFLTCNMADCSKTCFKWLVCIFLYFFGSSGLINVLLPEGLTWWFFFAFLVAGGSAWTQSSCFMLILIG